MTRNRRKVVLATIVSLVGASTAIPVITSGTASAQEGSRICGIQYQTNDQVNWEFVYRIYEVPKAAIDLECVSAQGTGGRHPSDSGFTLMSKEWSGGKAFGAETCEDFTRDLGAPIVGAQTITGTTIDQNDICNNMERSDSVDRMRSYFLYGSWNRTDWLFAPR